jgi:hypothetical protein
MWGINSVGTHYTDRLLRNVKDSFKFPRQAYQPAQGIGRQSLQNPNAFYDFLILGSHSLQSAANFYLDLYI